MKASRSFDDYMSNWTTKCCIIYIRNGKEKRSPWFKNLEHAYKALEILKAKYERAIIYID